MMTSSPNSIPMVRLPRLSRGELLTLGKLTLRVLADSERTLDIVEGEEISGQAQLRALLRAGVLDNEEGRALLRDRPQIPDTDMGTLRALPAESLGGALARFLDRYGLDLELGRQRTPHTEDEEVAFLLTRIRQSHDIWHTLLGLGTAGHEEVLVHAFSLAQTGLPVSVAIVALGGVKHMVLERRWRTLRHGVRRAYRLGRQAAPLLSVYWERRWEEPVAEVRRALNVEEY